MEKVIEMFINEEDELSGIEAISVVESPAIEEDFIALKEHKEIKLAEVDKEKRILMGAALIPNKKIFRKGDKEDEDYYIFFSEDTVRRASELFLMKGNQNNSTFEHSVELEGMSVVESWILEDKEKDKSAKYGFDLPLGTWLVSVKVNNDKVWAKVKEGEVKGFSIEGYFAEQYDLSNKKVEQCQPCLDELNSEFELLELLEQLSEEVELESYGGYPESASNNAKRGIELNKKVNNKCATQVGKVRARQLAAKENFTLSTLKRIHSFLSRAETYYNPKDTEACGTISYLLWGGLSMKNWVESKLKGLDELNLAEKVIDGHTAYDTAEQAYAVAKSKGCEGIHTHNSDGKTWYMPCKDHSQLAKVGKKGAIVKSPKAPKSDTPNPSPKGKGSAKGKATGKTGAKVSAKDRKTLQNKANDFNERNKSKLGYGVTVGMLASVFQRGLGAFNTSRSPRVKSASQWAFARVNAFLYLVKNGRPQNPKYTTDNDLLPTKHPKSSK